MPEKNLDAIDHLGREALAHYIPGYDWVPGKFGPPPGIPKARKEQLDKMGDKEYLYAVVKMSQEERESLMVSEAERRRTFTAHWPIESLVKGADCAKEGFYYTGKADRVQCAFCAGIIRNWSKGDVPHIQHKNYFNYCKLVQNKPCYNIPLSDCAIPDNLTTNQLSTTTAGRKDQKIATLGDLNINTVKPKLPRLSVYSKRWETFRSYSVDNPIPAIQLCEAGFFFEGTGDKVKCFWCDGALELWTYGDNPWSEHAKWYPGCTFVQQNKGLDFIRRARAEMTPENRETSDTLMYNKGDTAFLEVKAEPPVKKKEIHELNGYMFCQSLEYPVEHILKAYAANDNEEFKDPATLLGIVQDLDEGDFSSLEEYTRERKNRLLGDDSEKMDVTASAKPRRIAHISVADTVANGNDLTPLESREFVAALTCRKCNRNVCGAVVLPCGCFCLCQDCSKENLPIKCPTCSSLVKGACRTFLC